MPDGYIGFNNFITLGTALTFISLVIFLYIVSVTVFNPRRTEINALVLGRFDRITLDLRRWVLQSRKENDIKV